MFWTPSLFVQPRMLGRENNKSIPLNASLICWQKLSNQVFTSGSFTKARLNYINSRLLPINLNISLFALSKWIEIGSELGIYFCDNPRILYCPPWQEKNNVNHWKVLGFQACILYVTCYFRWWKYLSKNCSNCQVGILGQVRLNVLLIFGFWCHGHVKNVYCKYKFVIQIYSKFVYQNQKKKKKNHYYIAVLRL